MGRKEVGMVFDLGLGMKKVDQIYTLQNLGYGKEQIADEVGVSVYHVKACMYTIRDYSKKNMARRLKAMGKRTTDIALELGVAMPRVRDLLHLPKNIIERVDVESGHKMYFYSFKHLKKYMPKLTLYRYKRLKHGGESYWGYYIKEVKSNKDNYYYEFAE